MPEAKFELLQCADCGTQLSHAAPVCPKCLGNRLEPHSANGAARLEAWTIIRKPTAAFADGGPFIVGVARLDAGDRLISGRVERADDSLAVGDRLTVTRDPEGRIVLRVGGNG